MNKFKFEPPQEHRRSLQQPKNEHLNLVTTLDKCTQIVRQDRLFLRNQIKNCNPQLLQIFRQFPRTSQLQNLQIKLRKFVQNVKNRIKTEQLNKFKETLSTNSIVAQPKRQNNQLKPSQSTLKQPLKPNCSVQLNRTTNNRNKSAQHSNSISNHLNMNSSLRHFQQLLKNKFNQEVIQQRQSENVTSARQNRQEQQHNKSKPLQQHFFDSQQNKMAGKSASYHPFMPNKTLDSNLTFLNQFNKQKLKLNIEEPTNKSTAWQFQKKAKKALYQFQNIPEKQPQQINFGLRHKQSAYEQKQDSIFDKHYYGWQKESKIEPNQYFSQSSNTYDIKNPISFSIKDASQINLVHSKFQEPEKANIMEKQQPFPLKEQEFARQVTLPVKTSISRIEGSRLSQQNLFTPMDLLNECRNFLKHRQNSTQKSNIELNLGDTSLTQLQINIHAQEPIINERKEQKQQLNLLQDKMDSMKKQEDSAYVFPQIKESNKKSQGNLIESNKKPEDYHFTHFQTFANSLDQKPFIYPSKVPSVPSKHVFKGLQQKVPLDFSIQDLLQSMMEITDMSPFITVKSLVNLVNNHPNSEVLKSIFSKYLQMSKNDEICLTNLSSLINEKYNQEHKISYPHSDKTINSVYDLLDIDQKGYINKEDVDTFLSQIEEAQVQNYEQVSQELWRLFEGADFNNQHKLTYWHFYLVKNSEQFQRVSQLLGEFEFEIQRNQ